MRTGRCLCGAVAYELTAEPQMMGFCQCRDCQYVTGGEPAAVAIAPQGSFKLTRGELKAYRRAAESGAVADRHFCAECGTHVASRLDAGLFVAVKVGTLDEPLPAALPRIEVWGASAQPWAHRPEGAARFEREGA